MSGPDDAGITGGVGVGIASGKVSLERVWIDATSDRGVDVEDFSGPAELTIADSLIEGAHDIAVFASGAKLTIDRSVVRGTKLVGGGANITAGANAIAALTASNPVTPPSTNPTTWTATAPAGCGWSRRRPGMPRGSARSAPGP